MDMSRENCATVVLETCVNTKTGDGTKDEFSPSVLVIEPFNGGSHKQLIDLLTKELIPTAHVYSLPAKKWKW